MVIQRALGHQPTFELIDFITLVEQREGNALVSEATVKLRVGGQVMHTAAEGNGPVNALDGALRKALVPLYPAIGEMRLFDYKVRVVNESAGTAARVRVLIESGDRHGRWSTVGCSANVIEASWLALADAMEYGLLRARQGKAADPKPGPADPSSGRGALAATAAESPANPESHQRG